MDEAGSGFHVSCWFSVQTKQMKQISADLMPLLTGKDNEVVLASTYMNAFGEDDANKVSTSIISPVESEAPVWALIQPQWNRLPGWQPGKTPRRIDAKAAVFSLGRFVFDDSTFSGFRIHLENGNAVV